MTATVTWVEKKGDTAAILVMSDETRVWTPDKAKADALVGKEIPSDWKQQEGKYGPQALPPQDKRTAPAAFRNTKEGQAVEQERMDRRTALMQAVAMGGFDATNVTYVRAMLESATDLYDWLRKTSGAAVATVSDNGEVKAPGPRIEAQASPSTSEGVAEVIGEGAEVTPPGHEHAWVPSPKLKSFDVCAKPDCYETRKRAVVDV